MSTEDCEGHSGMYYSGTTLANTNLVSRTAEAVGRSSENSSTREHLESAEFQESSPAHEQTSSDSLSAIRRSYQVRNISSKATNIILASWRRGTQKQYITHIKKWLSFCDKKQINSVCADVNYVLDFLTEQFESGCGYSSVNTARCALSAIGLIKDGFAIGAHPIVIRFMKGIFNLKPVKARYCETWDVDKVLLYLRRLSPVVKLSLKMLSLKLAMLLALTLASRTQSIHLLSISNIQKGYDTYTLHYSDLLKQTRLGKSNPVATLKAYPVDRRLCVIYTLKEYLKRTECIRGSKTCLFLSYVKPHNNVSRDTISRWLRTVMSNAGIDCNKFKTHSIRSASTSKAKQQFVPIDQILKVAGWSNTKTFGTYYDKPVAADQNSFSEAVLRL